MNIKRIIFGNRNFKLWYYIVAEYRFHFANHKSYQKNKILDRLSRYDVKYIEDRVNYYNKLQRKIEISDFPYTIGNYKKPIHLKTYFYDSQQYLRYFSPQLKFNIHAGDITTVPEIPSIVKSRPINGENSNAVLLNLDKIRHFNFVKDHMPFEKKKNMLIGRAAVQQEHRKRFYHLYYGHPMCDLGDILKDSLWYSPKISISKHLEYKFILAIEGFDVATNLKWIMSSNSIAVMPKPKYETWFMEGRLLPGHYIEIKEDYSDLEQQLNYYISNSEQCLQIVEEANKYTKQFRDENKEELIAVKVLEKYFELV